MKLKGSVIICLFFPTYVTFVLVAYKKLTDGNLSHATQGSRNFLLAHGVFHEGVDENPGLQGRAHGRAWGDPDAPRIWNFGQQTVVRVMSSIRTDGTLLEETPTLRWFTSYEGFARQFQMFSCMVKYAEDSRRKLLLGRFESKHYKMGTDRDAGLPYMDEIVDLDALYNGDPRQPIITRVPRYDRSKGQKNSARCDLSIGIKIKWEDDDYDVDPDKAKQEGKKAR